jgi:hypothetical protein
MRRFPPPITGPHSGWSPQRDRNAQKRFRDALIKRSGGMCEFPECDQPGAEAHHDMAGYEPSCGRFLCKTHHKAEDPHAR